MAQILFTSGTTNEPRGVVLTHGNFLANLEPLEKGIEEYRKYERWVHPLRFVTLVPLSHVFGQFMTLFVPPLLGATVVFENSPHPAEILRTVKRERATALVAVPRMLDAARNALEQEIDSRGWRTWFASAYAAAEGEPFLRRVWRFRRLHRRLGWKFWACISGGAALSSETEAFFKRIGYAVVQGYGMTETASLISLNHPFRAALRFCRQNFARPRIPSRRRRRNPGSRRKCFRRLTGKQANCVRRPGNRRLAAHR